MSASRDRSQQFGECRDVDRVNRDDAGAPEASSRSVVAFEVAGSGAVRPSDVNAAAGRANREAGDPDVERQPNFDKAIWVAKAVARVRARIRVGHRELAKKIGIGLVACSAVHDCMLLLFSISGGGLLCTGLTMAASVSAWALHAALMLPFNDDAHLLWVHYGLLVASSFIQGIFRILWQEFMWGAYYLFVWRCVLYPLGARGLYSFLRTIHRFDAAKRDVISQSALVAFAGSAAPILYFYINGLLCLSFSDDPGQNCGIRTNVNFTTIYALIGNSGVLVLLTIKPVSLRQITHMNIPPLQLIAFGFLGVLFIIALVLYSQNESFGPTTLTVESLSTASGVCLILFSIAHVLSIVKDEKKKIVVVAAGDVVTSVDNRRHGTLIFFRAVMVSFTVVYLALLGFSLDAVAKPINPLSCAAVCIHIWLMMEDATLKLPVKLHFVAHASSAVIRATLSLRDGDRAGVARNVVYLVAFYPGVYAALTRTRASVRAHGDNAAANFVEKCFITFWVAIVPPLLYFGADTLGGRRLFPLLK